jgi:hypothetical protein
MVGVRDALTIRLAQVRLFRSLQRGSRVSDHLSNDSQDQMALRAFRSEAGPPNLFQSQ